MKPARRSRPPLAWIVPMGAALVALLLAGLGSGLAPEGPVGDPGLFFSLLILAAAAALHRPLGGASLGLGAATVPMAIQLLGPLPAAWMAGGALLCSELAHRMIERSGPRPLPERRRLHRPFEASATTALSTLAAGTAWVLVGPAAPLSGDDPHLWTAAGAAALTYGGLHIGLRVLEQHLYRPAERPRPAELLPPLLLDGLAWGVGTLLAVVASQLGSALGLLLVLCLTLLTLEAFRHGRARELAQERLAELQQISRAGQRMTAGGQEIAAVAAAIHGEIQRVLRFSWFQLELTPAALEAPGDGARSWAAGPDGTIYAGHPDPGSHPPFRPGIHRRRRWRGLSFPLLVDGRTLAHLRLWCDPRNLGSEDEEVLTDLLPQLAASLDRALLDRRARLDPLTGIAVRRVFEERLREAHSRCLDEGGSVAVLLCDLDHFKKINDTYGHLAGDQALIAVARLLSQTIRAGDLVCRFGGEEFIILAEGAEGLTALTLAEKLRRSVENLAFSTEGQTVPLSLSAGVAAFPELYVHSAEELPPLADTALYEAKRRGRNLCLLALGRGRYQAPDGRTFAADGVPEAPEPPRLLA